MAGKGRGCCHEERRGKDVQTPRWGSLLCTGLQNQRHWSPDVLTQDPLAWSPAVRTTSDFSTGTDDRKGPDDDYCKHGNTSTLSWALTSIFTDPVRGAVLGSLPAVSHLIFINPCGANIISPFYTHVPWTRQVCLWQWSTWLSHGESGPEDDAHPEGRRGGRWKEHVPSVLKPQSQPCLKLDFSVLRAITFSFTIS